MFRASRIAPVSALIFAFVLIRPAAAAQAGDLAGEEQPPLPEAWRLPPPAALGPDEERATFSLAPGLRIELVAAEPFVQDPVTASFDLDGALWVVEMRSYMPDADGHGERDPSGVIAILRDRDGDGRMDERTTFLDGLVLPRSVLPLGAGPEDGALVIAPPELLLARDTDGDGRADERTVLERGLPGVASPEHAINGLLLTLDNWIACANYDVRFRFTGAISAAHWTRQRVASGGQWGLSQDDCGRLFFDDNSDPLRGHRIAPHYAVRNASLRDASGVNERFADDFSVWPAHPTPGVNRGYQPDFLKDARLVKFTAACAPLVHRGDALPRAFRGNAFVCEPSGNLVKRFALAESESGAISARNVETGREFLASTDERFRPVWLADGPDGALYVVDMYRGVIQHRLFVTTFLRKQIDERALEKPIGRGRIWRIVPNDFKPARRASVAEASEDELAATLADANGWRRDAAQRRIVGAGGSGAIDTLHMRELLRKIVAESPSPLARQHALWCLEGLGRIDGELALRALVDPDPRVQIAAVRVSERLLAGSPAPLIARLVELARAGPPRVRQQVLLSLGEAANDAADAALCELITLDSSTNDARTAVASGLAHREVEFVQRCLGRAEWAEPAAGRAEFLALLAGCVVREGLGERVERLLDVILARAKTGAWQARALLDGALDARPSGPDGKPSFVRLARKPAAFDALVSLETEELRERARALAGALAWPGRADIEEIVVRPLNAVEQQSFERGRAIYAETCAPCHQPSGLGEPGRAPPLRASEWVLGSEQVLARILLHGMSGPLRIARRDWDMDMPAFAPSDAELAALLTYVRREWGHGAEPVTPDAIAAIRKSEEKRVRPWTVDELRALER